MMKGFIYLDYRKKFPAALADLQQWLLDGKIKRKYYIIKGGLEACPQGLMDMYAGANTGKTMVEVVPFSEAIPDSNNNKAKL